MSQERLEDIKVLRQRKVDTKKAADAIFAIAKAEKRDLTDDEGTTVDALIAKQTKTEADIVRREAFMDAERNELPAAGEAGRAAIPEAGKKPWTSLGEQMKAVHRCSVSHGQDTDPRLFVAATGANESVDAEGGFLVATEFTGGLWERTYQLGMVASRVFDQPMSTSRLVMNAVDEDSRANGSRFGGLQTYWLGEAGTYTGSKPKFRRMELNAKKLTGLFYATEEQLADGPAIESFINRAFPDEFAFRIDDAILNGTGVDQPLGVLNSGAVLEITKDSGDSGKTFSTADALAMDARLWPSSASSAVWFCNVDVKPKLYPLTLGTGTAVTLLYTPPGVNGNANGRLLGHEVVFIEQCATLGTPGDIILADMSQYMLGRRQGMRADTSMHVAFLTGEQAFRFMIRLDGQPLWKKPLTPKNGTNTLSPFLTLSTRS